MTHTARLLQQGVMLLAKAYQRLFLDLHYWGQENIPKGAKLIVANHISCDDATWVLPVLKEPIHFVVGPAYAYRLFQPFLDMTEQINAMPENRKAVVSQAAKYLSKGEAVYIAPEGDMFDPFELGKFYSGAAKIYRASGAPILPVALVAPRHSMTFHRGITTVVDGRVYRMLNVHRGTYCVSIGEPFQPKVLGGTEEEQNERITAEIKSRIQAMIEDVRYNKFWL